MYVDLKTLLTEIPYSKASIYRLIGEKKFPAQVRIGPNKVGWRRRDLNAWRAKFDPEPAMDDELEELLS